MSNTVPEGWAIHPLDDKVDILSGFPFKSSLFCDDPSKMGIIRIRDLVKQSVETFYSGDFDDAYVIRKGDILIGMDGDFNIVKWKTKNALLNQRICKVKASKSGGFDSDFLFYSLVDDLDSIHAATGATTVKHLSVKDIKGIEKSYPPLPEQEKIAAILSSVDEVIEKTLAQIDKLKDLKTGMMQELLTKGIGQGGVPHTEFKDSPVGQIPLSWGVVPLINVVSKIVDCEHKTAPYVDSSEYLVVRTSNVRSGQLIQEDMKFTTKDGFEQWTQRALPTEGDVLFTREAPAGESCMVPTGLKVCMGQRMVLLRPNKEKIYPCFFSLFLISEAAQQAIYELSIGTTVSRINIEDIKRIPCLVPPLGEQVEIYSSVQAIQTLITVKEQMLESTKSNKKALMQDLLTGKVRVNVEARELAEA
ncbi:restriction endonuclease subunit S [Halomonas sp. hl-4]|uniref:restriction endonuclease subunit S n=1 Tax=Halomonas sp. hl-4 TaxID=1761789 RepID=UPI000BB9347E|nr:restriction endonuclease subunit S [Halomonas sp. hl-4]SNY97903.1 type I restriction enzyme, S subunit [Halomonas sp. hl-4]